MSKLKLKPKRPKQRGVTERQIKFNELDTKFAIQVEGKFESVVMISANKEGRKIAEDMWPDVEWSRDDKFSSCHSDEWRFTHIRVTRLPPYLEKAVPLAFANAESLGYAVALALHHRAWPLQVGWWSGEGTDITINTFGKRTAPDEGADLALYADYVPPGGALRTLAAS
jgi:hypothetical protein